MKTARALACLAAACLVGVAAAQPCTPPAPTGLAGEAQACAVTLRWNATPTAQSYDVIRRQYVGGPEETVGVAFEPRFVDAAAREGTSQYLVRAANICGVGPVSQPVTVVGNPGTPPRPWFVYASGGDCSAVRVSWSSFGSGTRARVYRSTTTRFEDASIIAEVVNAYGFDDLSALPGTVYRYWVQGFNGVCAGLPGGPDDGSMVELRGAPQDVTASDGTYCHAVQVDWNYFYCHEYFAVYRSATPSPTDAVVIGTTQDAPYLDESADTGRRYWYWVRAFAGRQIGSLSSPAVSGMRGENSLPRFDLYNDSVSVVPEASVSLSMGYLGASEFTYQWRKNGVDLQDGEQIFGATEPELTIERVLGDDAGEYTVVATSACGTAESPAITLTVGYDACPPFLGDYNQDGGVDGADVEAFYSDWEQSAFCADVNYDGGVDGQDVEWFFICWESC